MSNQIELCEQARGCLDFAKVALERARAAAANSDKELMLLMASAWVKLAQQWQEHRSALIENGKAPDAPTPAPQ